MARLQSLQTLSSALDFGSQPEELPPEALPQAVFPQLAWKGAR